MSVRFHCLIGFTKIAMAKMLIKAFWQGYQDHTVWVHQLAFFFFSLNELLRDCQVHNFSIKQSRCLWIADFLLQFKQCNKNITLTVQELQPFLYTLPARTTTFSYWAPWVSTQSWWFSFQWKAKMSLGCQIVWMQEKSCICCYCYITLIYNIYF